VLPAVARLSPTIPSLDAEIEPDAASHTQSWASIAFLRHACESELKDGMMPPICCR
jgi:hypothetical protein